MFLSKKEGCPSSWPSKATRSALLLPYIYMYICTEREFRVLRSRPVSLRRIVLLFTEGRLANDGHLRRPLRTWRLDELAPLRPHVRNRELKKKEESKSRNIRIIKYMKYFFLKKTQKKRFHESISIRCQLMHVNILRVPFSKTA